MLNMGAAGPDKEDELNSLNWRFLGAAGPSQSYMVVRHYKPRGWTSRALETIKSLSSNERKGRKEAETKETDAWALAGSLCLKIWENRQPT